MPYHPRPISSLGPKGPLDDTAYDTDIHRFDNGMVIILMVVLFRSLYLVKKNFGPMIADQEKINGCVQFAFQLSPFFKPACQK
jgi:hypothetical protein